MRISSKKYRIRLLYIVVGATEVWGHLIYSATNVCHTRKQCLAAHVLTCRKMFWLVHGWVLGKGMHFKQRNEEVSDMGKIMLK